MTGFEATNSIPPQKNPRHYRLVRKNSKSYIGAATILFIMVVLLCGNNYNLLNSYKVLKNELTTAYSELNKEKSEKQQIINEVDKMRKKYDQLSEEFSRLNDNFTKASRGSEDLFRQMEDLKKQNSELSKQVKDLSDDNIALQNSLKMAASVGVKPQNYSIFEGIEPSDTLSRGKYIGKFLGTAYTPSKEECGNDKGITKSGKPIIPGISIAIDNKYWPFGTVFYIKSLGNTVAMDTGSAIKGKYRFDFSVLDKEFAKLLGSRKWEVYLVKMGNGKVEIAL